MPSESGPSDVRRVLNGNEHSMSSPARSYSGGGPSSSSTRTLHQASSSSLSNQVGMQASPSTARPGNAGQVTIESSLAQAGGSYEVALAQVIEDRNNIHNQNSLLWKRMETAKITVASFKKDLDRIRAERDRAHARIHQLTGEDPRARPTAHRAPSLDTVAPNPILSERPPAVRHLSETGSNASLGSIHESPSQAHPPLPTPTPSRPSLASEASSSGAFHDPHSRPTISTSIIPPTPTKRAQPDGNRSAGAAQPPPHHLPDNSPLRERGAIDASPSPSRSSEDIQINITSSSPGGSLTASTTLTPETASGSRKKARESRISLPDETARYLTYNNLIDSPVSSPALAAGGGNLGVGQGSSVPPSPLRDVQSAEGVENELDGLSSGPPPERLRIAKGEAAAASVSSFGEFLELEATEEGRRNESPSSSGATTGGAGASSQGTSVETVPSTTTNGPAAQQQPQGLTSRVAATHASAPSPARDRAPRRPPSRDAVTESSASNSKSQTSSQGSSAADYASIPEERESLDSTMSAPRASGPSIDSTTVTTPDTTPSEFMPSGGNPNGTSVPFPSVQSTPSRPQPSGQPQQRHGSQHSQQQQPPPLRIGSQPGANASSGDLVHRIEYKSAKLTNDDLQHTTVRVDGSTIKSNDRGKEVLCFVVNVSVKGKEPWKVEKLYSDVLALDGRVRTSSGKVHGKRIAPLPDSKLFKDNAPAKVDQRKAALEVYLQSLVQVQSHTAMRKLDDVCMFFSTGIMKPEHAPVHQVGHKEGYLTKRSKGFGGFLKWKTRYFVLQGASLEYYDSRGGQHQGSISILNAQIGRQQKTVAATDDDEHAFRHAFLIIEAKRPPANSPTRHVLCAESDVERDSWVDALVRHVAGDYYAEDEVARPPPYGGSQADLPPLKTDVSHHVHHSSSTNSFSSPTDGRRYITKDLIGRPISTMPPSSASDDSNTPTSTHMQNGNVARTIMASHHGSSENVSPLSSSLPDTTNPLSAVSNNAALLGMPRANSEMGHYPDLAESNANNNIPAGRSSTSTPGGGLRVPHNRNSYHPSHKGISPTDTIASSSEINLSASTSNLASNKGKQISGPMNGTPIPAGYNFGGGKDAPAPADAGGGGKDSKDAASERERDRKTKSSHFWPFGGGGGGGGGSGGGAGGGSHSNSNGGSGGGGKGPPRAVFGVPIMDSLAVSQIANLPSVVFRCIQYLEIKEAEKEEGIYRLSGSSAVIKSLKDRFNTHGDVDLLNSEEYWDPHAVAGLLKSYFRELPTSILTHERHFRFLKVIDLADANDRVAELGHLITNLPLPNYCLLRALCAHLIRIVQHSSLNKMTVRNVGIVFSPTLGIPAGVFSLMLSDFPHVFGIVPLEPKPEEEAEEDQVEDEVEPEVEGVDLVAAGAGGMEGEATPRNPQGVSPAIHIHASNRNSIGYAEGSADRLLGLAGRSLTTPDEEDSNDEEILQQDDSDEETEDAQSAIDEEDDVSSGAYDSQSSQATVRAMNSSTSATPTSARNMSHGASVAATRGLQIRTERPSRGALSPKLGSSGGPGLPASPRPQRQMSSPPAT